MNRIPLLVAALAGSLPGSGLPAVAQAPTSERPTNEMPNAYRTIEGWARMPAGRSWGSTSAVEIERDGVSVWVAERCGANSCVGSNLDPILKFDSTGTLVRSFGAGLLASPHGITVDRDGNVLVTDCLCTGSEAQRQAAAPESKGHQVFKFAPDGTVVLTLGKAGGGREPEFFYQPNDVLVAPNGDIFVAEGHSSAEGANARILKFSSDGRFLKAWGKKGTGPGEFDQPHALAMDSRGRPAHAAWLRGIRIGSARNGRVTEFIPDPNQNATNTSAAEGVAVDSWGIIYGAEVGPRALKRYIRMEGTRP